MKVRLLYFARLRETFGISQEAVELPADVTTLEALVTWLRQRGGVWAEQLADGRSYRMAINQEMADPGSVIQDGSEVAIFPPVTGG